MQAVKIIGSNKLETSVANREIIPDAPKNWTMPIRLKKFSLMNYSDCVLIINGEEVFLKANQGFTTGYDDVMISSVKIKETGIEYNWIGAY